MGYRALQSIIDSGVVKLDYSSIDEKTVLVWYCNLDAERTPRQSGSFKDPLVLPNDPTEWLLDLCVSIDEVRRCTIEKNDARSFANWIKEIGSPMVGPIYRDDVKAAQQEYEDVLDMLIDRWEFIKEAQRHLRWIFGQAQFDRILAEALRND